jgi:hypothetical protein
MTTPANPDKESEKQAKAAARRPVLERMVERLRSSRRIRDKGQREPNWLMEETDLLAPLVINLQNRTMGLTQAVNAAKPHLPRRSIFAIRQRLIILRKNAQRPNNS